MNSSEQQPVITGIPERPASGLGLGSFVRNSGLAYLSTIAVMILSSVTKVLLARSLTPHELGLFVTAQTLATLGIALAQMSVPEALVRFMGQFGPDGVTRSVAFIRTALWTSVGASLALLLVTFAGAGAFSRTFYRQDELAPILTILAIAWPLSTVAVVLTSAYRGIGSVVEKILYIDLTSGVLVVAGLLVLKALGRRSVFDASWLYVVVAAISAVLAMKRFAGDPRWRVQADYRTSGELLRYSLPLLAANLVAWPMAFIPLILGASNIEGVAQFNLAISLSALVYTIVSAAEMAALPFWASEIAAGNKSGLKADYASSTSWCFVAGSAVFAVLFFCPGEVIGLLYGRQYVAGASTLRWIAPVFLLNSATGPNESLLKALGCTRWIFVTRTAVGLSVIISTVIMKSSDGLSRAIASYWISAGVGLFMYSGRLVASGLHPVSKAYLMAWISIAASLCVAGWTGTWFSSYSDLLHIVLTGAVYAVTLAVALSLTGYTDSEDAAKLGAVIRSLSSRYAPAT